MKLYEVYLNNGLDYEDESHFTFLKVANSREEIKAYIKSQDFEFAYYLEYDDSFYEITEINELEGYEIILIKKENE